MALNPDVVRWAAVIDEALRQEGRRFERWSARFSLEQLAGVTLAVIHKESGGNHDLWAGQHLNQAQGSAYGLTQFKLYWSRQETRFGVRAGKGDVADAEGSPLQHVLFYLRHLVTLLGPADGELGTAIFARASGEPQVKAWVETGKFKAAYVPAHLEYVRTLFSGLYPGYMGWWRAWAAQGKPSAVATIARVGGTRRERGQDYTVAPAQWQVALAPPGALTGVPRATDAPYTGVHVWGGFARRYDGKERAAEVAVSGAEPLSAQDVQRSSTSLLAVTESRRTRRDLTGRREAEKEEQRRTQAAQQRGVVDWQRAYREVGARAQGVYTGLQYDYETGQWI